MSVSRQGGNRAIPDMLHRRGVEDDLHPAEQQSFHRIAYGMGRAVPADHRRTLIDMGLAFIDDIGLLALTEAGWQRYERETAERPVAY